ncbi:LacI family transcriptional regulator [Bacilli bacterium PM5-3]|nr:LacI family transcriptional regulator [Bacilli bacterium PM5-3]MDH6603825.1 LacI family transcriptional regulator [Bacilli bacterium PM5-9]
MNKKVTIYDVASEAKVSLATVSRVINNSQSVKPATRERVLKAIDDLNFVPNAVAQGLALNKSYNIALIVPEASFSFISTIINGVVDVTHIYNYNVVLYSTNFGQFEVDKIIDKVIKNRLDGVIILNSELTTKALDQLSRYNIPVTVVGTPLQGKLRTSVYVDYEEATYNVVMKYLKDGKDKIVFLDGDYNRFIVEEMLIGIKKAYKENNLEFKGHLQIGDSYLTSYNEIKKYLENNDVDLCLGARDSLAIAALNAALDLNKNIPNDLEIIGFNNTKYSRMARPALSTVHVPLYELGAIAARHMTKMLNKEIVENSNHKLETYLVERLTTK